MLKSTYLGYTVYSDGRIKSNGKRKVFLKGYDVGKGYDSVKLIGINFANFTYILRIFVIQNKILYFVYKNISRLD